jgi:hypothetical protein
VEVGNSRKTALAERRQGALTLLESPGLLCRAADRVYLDAAHKGKHAMSVDASDFDKKRYFARTSLGPGRWFWVVSLGFGPNRVVAEGIAPTPESALAEAIRRFGDVEQTHAYYAAGYRRYVKALQRQQEAANNGPARPPGKPELAWECYTWVSDYDWRASESITPHRIVKKTKTRIYVDVEPWRDDLNPPTGGGSWWDYAQYTFVLDRREWERTGKARRSGHHTWGTYYRDPEMFRAERDRSIPS